MNQPQDHVIIYAHDFGVRKTDRGLFPAIAQTAPDAESVMFDFYPVHEVSKTLTAKPLDEQALKLRKVINTARAEYPGAVLDLVCHGQGCVVGALVKTRGLRKVVLLAPPAVLSSDALITQLGDRLESPVDTAVRTRISDTNGSTTVIQPDFWQSLENLEPVRLYSRLARVTTLRIINARSDEMYGSQDLSGIEPGISMITLDGNHNFDSPADRDRLLYIMKKELAV